MSNVIFFHVYGKGKWEEIYNEMMNVIFESKLIDISKLNICFVGNINTFNVKNKFTHTNITISHVSSNLSSNEWSTLKLLYDVNANYKVLYIHTKGVTRNNAATRSWRKYMIYFNIRKWKTCVNKLNDFDTCGVELIHNKDKNTLLTTLKIRYAYKFYAGNFWWANSDYLLTLPKLHEMKTKYRWSAERWIGLNENAKHYSLYQSKIDLYKKQLHKHIYEELN